MAHITGRVRIAAQLERVFDTVADSRNEPSFNSAMTDVELLTPLPIGQGAFPCAHGKAEHGDAFFHEVDDVEHSSRQWSPTRLGHTS